MIDPNNITTIRVGQLADAPLNLTDNIPHEVGTNLKRATVQEFVDFIATAIGSGSGVGFLPISVTDGQQLPDVPADPSFFLCGAGTFLNINGYPNIVCTADLNAIMSLSDHWEIAVEIPITPDVTTITLQKVTEAGAFTYIPIIIETGADTAMTAYTFGTTAISGESEFGEGVAGVSARGVGVSGRGNTAPGVYGYSNSWPAAIFEVPDTNSYNIAEFHTQGETKASIGVNGDIRGNDIFIEKVNLYDAPNDSYGSIHFTDGNFHIEDADGHKLLVIEDGFIQLHKTDTIQSNLYTSGLTAIRDHYLPDANGTIALLSDIPSTPNLQDVTTEGATTTTSITANSFIKTGGLSTEFLMADGSVIADLNYDNMEIFYKVSTLQNRTIADGGTFEAKKCLFNQLSNLNNI